MQGSVWNTLKRKEECNKGDWFELLKQDFDFIGVEMNENLFKYTEQPK